MASKVVQLRQELDAFHEKFNVLQSQRFVHQRMKHHMNKVRSMQMQQRERFDHEHQEEHGEAVKDLRRHIDARGGSPSDPKLLRDFESCERKTAQIRQNLQRAAPERRSQVRLFLETPNSATADIRSQLEAFDQRVAKAKDKLKQYAFILQH